MVGGTFCAVSATARSEGAAAPLDVVLRRAGAVLASRDGRPVTPGSGEEGEIVVRGPSVSLGYFCDPEQTSQRFRAGSFHTGDLATVDADGYLVARHDFPEPVGPSFWERGPSA